MVCQQRHSDKEYVSIQEETAGTLQELNLLHLVSHVSNAPTRLSFHKRPNATLHKHVAYLHCFYFGFKFNFQL